MVIEDAAATEIVYNSVWRNSSSVISCGADFCIKRWDLAGAKDGPLTDYLGHVAPVRKLALAPDGRTMLSGAEDGSIRGWIIEEMEEIKQCHESIGSNFKARSKEWEHIQAVLDER